MMTYFKFPKSNPDKRGIRRIRFRTWMASKYVE